LEYYFNELDPSAFQRLINAILLARFGENLRLTPLRGTDGGRDGETAPSNPYFEFQVSDVNPPTRSLFAPPEKGRYLFQVKFHRTVNGRMSDHRGVVISDFERELKNNVLTRTGSERVNHFILITNVPASGEAIAKVDQKQSELLSGIRNLHVDVWWEEEVVAFLDQMPNLWNSFPEIFPGRRVPFLAEVAGGAPKALPRAVYMAIDRQYQRDSSVKFRQIDLEQNLSKLFVDLDVNLQYLPLEEQQYLFSEDLRRLVSLTPRQRGLLVDTEEIENDTELINRQLRYGLHRATRHASVLGVLLDENRSSTQQIILEGGPGQGKSTITQMMIQIYRQQLLKKTDMDPEGRWIPPQKSRLPFRIELRLFAEWLIKNPKDSVEQYLASIIKQDSGGSQVSVDDIHTMVEDSPVLLICDGLDEVGSDELREEILIKITECIHRFKANLHSDIRVVITTRPPAIAGCREHLVDFKRLPIAPMETDRINNYVSRWISVQVRDPDDQQRVRASFERRRGEAHVQALVKNPMQLSVLLHFIRLKGEAFPDQRAELYRDYFQIVIDRDVEKSAALRKQRRTIEALHQFLGYKIHALTEAEQADGSLTREQLLSMVEGWLKARGTESETAQGLFKLGEERLGLIVTLKGEGEEARYGYEIQPIREYFAAAFINDQIEGNAHAVFQSMVRRPYWREVALFLAGLRRLNEKSDLVARARSLDNEEEFGWRQDGRIITLQLLQEGVFSEAGHVFSDALDFVFDLLDPKMVRIQNEPDDFLEALSNLIKQSGSKQLASRINQLLEEYDTCNDEYVLYRLYRIASQLLTQEAIGLAILRYRGADPNLVAKVRLVWPYSYSIDVSNTAKVDSFWHDVNELTWAKWWFYVGVRADLATNLPAPTHFHQLLVRQLAMNSITYNTWYHNRFAQMNLLSKWAVWKLISYQKMLSLTTMTSTRGLSERVQSMIRAAIDDDTDIDYTGLDSVTSAIVRDLLKVMRDVLADKLARNDKTADTLAIHTPALVKYLKQPGLLSWLACGCTVALLRAVVTEYIAHTRPVPIMEQTAIGELLIQKEPLRTLWDEVRIFYQPESSNPDTGRINDDSSLALLLSDIYRSSRTFRSAYFDNTPLRIRLQEDGELVDIVDILADYVNETKDMPFDWIKSIPMTTRCIRPLLDKCKSDLPRLLRVLSSLHFVHPGRGRPLLTPDMQRILKIVRSTNDQEILVGALITLSTSKFLLTAGKDLILKLIRAESNRTGFTTDLFARFRTDNSEGDSKEIELITEIAKEILKDPYGYAFRLVCKAADYLAEQSPINRPPLLNEEDALGIKIASSSWRSEQRE
jgi:hypothetical protein